MATITSGADRFLRDASAKHIPLGYEPFPKQQQFHASPAKYRLFGGAAGPGKTKALLMEAILQAHEHPGANTLLLRRTFPELEQSLLLYFRRDVPRELYKSFNESKHVVTWQNNSTTRFGYCQSESDVYQYQGAEFLFIGIDELTLFTLRQWQFLTSRNRCPIANSFPCMAGATNPGNIGHAWVKSLWIDQQPAPGMENASEYDPADYDFISARVSDNPVYAGDESYLKTLRALPSHLRRAFLDGNWDVFAGQYFDNFDCDRHVVRAERVNWERWWPRWISIDWGFEHPAAVYWHAAIPTPNASTLSSRARPSADPPHSADEGSAFDCRSAPTSVGANSDLRVPHPRASREGGSPHEDACLDVARPPSGSCSAGFQPAVSYLTVADSCRDETHSASAPVGAGVSGAGTPLSRAEPRDACASSVEVRDFSPAKEDGLESPSLLPQAVAEADEPEQQVHARHWPNYSHSTISGVEDSTGRSACATQIVVTYREYVTRRTTPRDLAREIVARSLLNDCHSEAGPLLDGAEESAFRPAAQLQQQIPRRPEGGLARDDSAEQGSGAREKIDAIYLSPDAFANRTGEASIAEQMGDVFAAAGLPRPVPADDDRVGGWMLMYQMLEAAKRGPQVDAEQGSRGPGEGRSGDQSSLGDQAWLLTDNCFELIRTLPSLVRDPVRVEDIEKCDGDDPADAARYGLKSRYAAHRGDPGGWRSRMPLADRIAAHTYSADPTIRAMQSRKFTLEESRGHSPGRVPFHHRRH
jgi:hypothetical protein